MSEQKNPNSIDELADEMSDEINDFDPPSDEQDQNAAPAEPATPNMVDPDDYSIDELKSALDDEDSEADANEQPAAKEEGADKAADGQLTILLEDGTESFLPKNAKLRVTSRSGKTGEVSLQDYQNEFFGRQEIDRQMNDLHLRRKELEPLERLRENINDSSTSGFLKVHTLFGDLAELNPNFSQDVREYANFLVNYANMPPEEQRQALLQVENQHLRAASARQPANPQYFDESLVKVTQALGLQPGSEEVLRKIIVDAGRMPKTFHPQEIDGLMSEVIQDFAQAQAQKVLNVVDQLGISEKSDDNGLAAGRELLALYRSNPNWSEEQLVDKAKRLFGLQASNTKEKAKQRVALYEAQAGRKASKPKPQTRAQLLSDDDDIDLIAQKLKQLGE